ARLLGGALQHRAGERRDGQESRGAAGPGAVRGQGAARPLRPRPGEGPDAAAGARRMRRRRTTRPPGAAPAPRPPPGLRAAGRRAAALAAAALLAAGLAAAGLGCGGRRGGVGPFPKAPIVLISIDTLRSDHLPAYGYRGVATPAIDRLRRDAVLYERAYSHVP